MWNLSFFFGAIYNIYLHKELAIVDKVIILGLCGHFDTDMNNQLQEFDVNNAHCFDLNEELKSRQLMYDMRTARSASIHLIT